MPTNLFSAPAFVPDDAFPPFLERSWKSSIATVQEVLKEAIAVGGSSISDYVDADGEEGFFQLQHRVYGREGEPCLVCKKPVKRVVIVGRSSHYCAKCQK